MDKCVKLAVLSSLFLSQGLQARVIYGEDHRKEVSEATPFQQKLAASAASMIELGQITKDPSKPGLLQLNQKTLKEWLESQGEEESEKLKFSPKVVEAAKAGITFCDGERFINQPNPSMCSGFLIAPDLIVTAGHCAELPSFCSSYRWVFDFKVNPENQTAGVDVKEENVYECKRVVSDLLSMPLGLDYAIIQLDRRVTGREPLEVRNDSRVESNTPLVVIGSPSGLPLKVAAGANVRDNLHPYFFNANLDTFQGNSGSAVFNAETGVVEGILVRGEEDFIPNPEKMCIEAKKCLNNECRGEDITRMTAIPEIGVKRALNKAAFNGDMEVLESILKLNIWVDFYGKDGQSSLMKAIQGGQKKAVLALINKGADVNLQDAEGNTSLHHLAKSMNEENKEILEVLLSHKGNLEIKNNLGETPLSLLTKKAIEALP